MHPRPIVHLLTAPGRALCGRTGWGMSDAEGALKEPEHVTCKKCLDLLSPSPATPERRAA